MNPIGMAAGRHNSPSSHDHRFTLKAVLDPLIATALLLVAGVWLAVIALAVWLDSAGPILSRERRVGRDGREFDLLRFSSTVLELSCDGACEGDGTGPVCVRVRRTTGVGRFLQRYSLDELPQLINVLWGDLSLVGPRPLAPGVTGHCGLPQPAPLPVKPGLTGLWGGRRASGSRWAEPMDVNDYVRNYSPVLDLLILWRAFRTVLRHG